MMEEHETGRSVHGNIAWAMIKTNKGGDFWFLHHSWFRLCIQAMAWSEAVEPTQAVQGATTVGLRQLLGSQACTWGEAHLTITLVAMRVFQEHLHPRILKFLRWGAGHPSGMPARSTSACASKGGPHQDL